LNDDFQDKDDILSKSSELDNADEEGRMIFVPTITKDDIRGIIAKVRAIYLFISMYLLLVIY
jgi:hypothetical protein